MSNRWIILFFMASLSTAAVGCGGGWFTDTLENLPPEKRGEYELVERRCSQCHGMDKLTKMYDRRTERLDWELVVEEMAEIEGSRIRPDEHERLTNLLHQWSQGAPR